MSYEKGAQGSRHLLRSVLSYKQKKKNTSLLAFYERAMLFFKNKKNEKKTIARTIQPSNTYVLLNNKNFAKHHNRQLQ